MMMGCIVSSDRLKCVPGQENHNVTLVVGIGAEAC